MSGHPKPEHKADQGGRNLTSADTPEERRSTHAGGDQRIKDQRLRLRRTLRPKRPLLRGSVAGHPGRSEHWRVVRTGSGHACLHVRAAQNAHSCIHYLVNNEYASISGRELLRRRLNYFRCEGCTKVLSAWIGGALALLDSVVTRYEPRERCSGSERPLGTRRCFLRSGWQCHASV